MLERRVHKPQRIILPRPRMGGKIWLLDEQGVFILEEGEGIIRTIACTHAGTGTLQVFDGVPDENGFFPDEDLPETDPKYEQRNGRPIYRATPTVMGSWMQDGGFYHGLTVFHTGGHENAGCCASIVWMPVGK